MDTILAHIYTDEIAEFNAINTGSIDTTDWPLTSTLVDSSNPNSFVNNPNLLVTSPIVAHDYFEVEFMLANNFWGINMDFGNNPNGVQLRQGISHLISKNLFVTTQSDIKGLANSIDSPVPLGSKFTQGGVTFTVANPNSCNWDLNFTETGSVCTQTGGPPGGTAYNCSLSTTCPTGSVTGTTNFPWQPQIGSADFCAAADHFITAFRHAGIGTLTRNSNCVLQPPSGQTSFPTAITSAPVDFFIKLDHHPRFEMGVSVAQEICALWTGVLTTGCNFPGTSIPLLTISPRGTVSSFCGYTTSTTTVNRCWWMYTAGFGGIFPIDSSLYFTYNSRFVSGVCIGPTNCITPPSGPCSSASVPTPSAADMMYLCNPAYDTASSTMEFAPNVAAAFSDATTAMDIFGHGAYTIPIWTDTNQNVYLNNWQRVLNTDGSGTFQTSQFLWLNDYKGNPAVPGEIRQGFKQTTRSLSPYIGTTIWDAAMLANVFDTPLAQNPLNTGQLLDWMTASHANLPNSQLGYPQCAAPPAPPVQPCFPATAVNNLRFYLRNDIFFQDGKQVTGFDVKFAFATLDANGAFLGTSLGPMTCGRNSSGVILFNCTDGVTVKSKTVVDIHLDSFGPFTNISVGTTFVLPGRYWSSSCPASTWDADAAQGNVPDSCMTLDPAKAGFGFDPIANHIFVGSGPWACIDVLGGTGAVGFGCSSTGTQNPPVDQTYTLTRFGKGQVPGASAMGEYFRSSGTLALYLWSGAIGDTSQDTITGSAISSCNSSSQGTPTLGTTSICGHWQQGIGQPGGLGLVTQSQVNIFQRFNFLNWVAPQNWASPPCSSPGNCTGATNPPDLMQALTGQTYFEGPNTIYSAASIRIGGTTAVGCTTAYNPASPSTSGGSDC